MQKGRRSAAETWGLALAKRIVSASKMYVGKGKTGMRETAIFK